MADTDVHSVVDLPFSPNGLESQENATFTSDGVALPSEASFSLPPPLNVAPSTETDDALDDTATSTSQDKEEADVDHSEDALAETPETGKTDANVTSNALDTSVHTEDASVSFLPPPIPVGQGPTEHSVSADLPSSSDPSSAPSGLPMALPPPIPTPTDSNTTSTTQTHDDIDSAVQGAGEAEKVAGIELPSSLPPPVSDSSNDVDSSSTDAITLPPALPPSENTLTDGQDASSNTELPAPIAGDASSPPDAEPVAEEPVVEVNLMDTIVAPTTPKLTHLTANRARGPGGARRPPTRGVVVESKAQSVPDKPMDMSQASELTLTPSPTSTSEVSSPVDSPSVARKQHRASLGMPMMAVDFSAVKLKPSASKESVETKPVAAEAPVPAVSDLRSHLRSRSASSSDVKKGVIDRAAPPSALPPPLPSGPPPPSMPSALPPPLPSGEIGDSIALASSPSEKKLKKKPAKLEKSGSEKDVEKMRKKEIKDKDLKDHKDAKDAKEKEKEAAKDKEKDHKEKEKEPKEPKTPKESKESKDAKKRNRLSSQAAALPAPVAIASSSSSDLPAPLPSALPAAPAAAPAQKEKKSAIASLLTSFFKARPKRESLVAQGVLLPDELPPPTGAAAVGAAVASPSSSKRPTPSSSAPSAPLPPPMADSPLPPVDSPQASPATKGKKLKSANSKKDLKANAVSAATSLPPPMAAPPTPPSARSESSAPSSAPPPPPIASIPAASPSSGKKSKASAAAAPPPPPMAAGIPAPPPPPPPPAGPPPPKASAKKSKGAPSSLPPPLPSGGPPSLPPPSAPPAVPSSGPPSALPPPLPSTAPPSKSKK